MGEEVQKKTIFDAFADLGETFTGGKTTSIQSKRREVREVTENLKTLLQRIARQLTLRVPDITYSSEELNTLTSLAQALENTSYSLDTIVIQASGEQLEEVIQKVNKATENAKEAFLYPLNQEDKIKIGTVLIALSTAFITTDPIRIYEAASEVIKVATNINQKYGNT